MNDYVESASVNGVLIRNGSTAGYAEKTENGTIPAASPYVLELEEVVHASSVPSCTIDGATANILGWSFTPASGEVAVDRARGLLKFNSADAGLAVAFTYIPAGTRLSAAKIGELYDANTTLEGMTDVDATGKADGDVVTWDATAGKYVLAEPAAGGGGTLDSLTDVDPAGKADGEVLTWDATAGKYVLAPVDPDAVTSVNGATGDVVLGLGNINGVTIASPADDQIFEYNGTAWVNGRKITSSDTEPTSPATGDIWLDTSGA